jgi:hypothetical protein
MSQPPATAAHRPGMTIRIEQLSLNVAQRQAIDRLIAPQWRSIGYDRNALVDDLRAILSSTTANEMVEFGILRTRAVFDADEVQQIFNSRVRRAWLEVDDCWPEEANGLGAVAVASAVHYATVHAAAAVVPEGPARDAVLALLDTHTVPELAGAAA